MSSDGHLRVALIGYGLSGRVFHAPLIAAVPDLAVTTVVTADPGRRARAAHELPQAQLLASATELWPRATDHDLVVVATGTPSHAALTLAAVQSGLPVVVEKPVAATLADARVMADAAVGSGVPVIPFHNRRWDSDHLTLRRLLAEGALGQAHRYESRFERWRPALPSPGWRESLHGAEGGGVLLDLGVHLVDQALDLFGPVTRVYAEIDARRATADDDVFVALAHASGVHSHLWASALSAAPGPRLRVLGSKSAFVVAHLDGQEAALRAGSTPMDAQFGVEPPDRWGRLEHGEEQAPEVVPAEQGRWGSFYPAVAAVVRHHAPPPIAFTDALSVMSVLEAARRSARTGEATRP